MAERSDSTDVPHTPDGTHRSGAGTTEAGRPHSGWSRQPQSAYEVGDSGGWGGPTRRENTGPVPKLSRDSTTAQPTAAQRSTMQRSTPQRSTPERSTPPAAQTSDSSPSTAETAWHVADGADGDARQGVPALRHPQTDPQFDDEHEPLLVDTRHPAGSGRDAAGTSRLSLSADAAPSRPGHLLRALADPTFRLRATTALVPPTYIVVALFLVLDYMRSIFDYSGAAGTSVGGFVGMLILLVVGLLKIAVVLFLTRLVLELCLNVAESRAETRRGTGG